MTTLTRKKRGTQRIEVLPAKVQHIEVQPPEVQHFEAYHALKQQIAIGYALVNARTELGLTQLDVAERMGVSQPAVARIEAGRNVSINTLVRYALALGRSISVKVLPRWTGRAE